MEIGTITQILKYVFFIGEWRLPAPSRTFATHLSEGVGFAIHPGHHVMATNSSECARAFRHHGRRVMRTTGAVMCRTRKHRARHGEFFFFCRQKIQAIGNMFAGKEARQALCNHAGNAGRR